MADLSTELRTYLLGVSGINSLVGSGTNARIYHHIVKQNVPLPYVVLDELGGQSSPLLEGSAAHAQASYRITAYANTNAGAAALWEVIRINLDRYGPATMGSVWIQEITQIAYRDRGIVETKDRSQKWIYHCSSIYDIWHSIADVVT
jgi:hypothetical protein